MTKLSITRFKPNPSHYNEFTKNLRGFLDQRTREGVEWLDGVRHMLRDYNPTDRHIIPITGALFEG
jgi:hypothetical protein